MRVASCLVIAAIVTLPSCGRDGPDDPAIAAPGAGIPVGAVGAVGASFDAPSTAIPEPPAPRTKRRASPHSPAPQIDPFADPPDAAPPKPHAAEPRGTAL